MDKIITINLGGYSIRIEEEAFETLKPYIRQIEDAFASTENGKEIINDIETRLAEMLIERTEEKRSATIDDVQFVKKTMGNPGDFEGSEAEEQPKQTSTENDTIRKKLYRDTENKLFGGVCSGISNYFSIDPTIVRLIWVGLILFFGTGVLLYFILWVIVPEAITTAQKLEMKGEAPTFDNIINRVKSEAGKVEQNIKAQNFGQKIGNIFNSLTPIFSLFFKIIAMFVGIAILIKLLIIILGLSIGVSFFNVHHQGNFIPEIPNFFSTWSELFFCKITAGLFLCIPLFAILIAIIKFIFYPKVKLKNTFKAMALVWLVTLPILIYFVYLGINNFRYYETLTYQKTEKIKSPLIIKADFNEHDYFFEKIEINISPSEDSLMYIETNQSANGKNKSNATEMAVNNGASYTLSNNELTLKTSDFYEKMGLYRGQKVAFNIKIPNGKSFTLDRSIQKTNASVEGQNLTYYTDEDNKKPISLLFIHNLLYCPACPDSIPYRSSGLSSFTNFNKIESAGMLDIEIRSGNTYSIQKYGPANVLEYLDIWQSGDVLVINMEHFNLKTRPRVVITMPEITSLKLSGTVDCKSGHFGGDELNLELSGASKINIDAEFGKINCEMSGVSKLDISGNTNSINVEASGSSHINAQALRSDIAKLDLSGVSMCLLGTSKSISGELSGAGKLEYSGNPVIEVTNSGISKIQKTAQ